MGLLHASKGQEPDRYIEIRKPPQSRDHSSEEKMSKVAPASEIQEITSKIAPVSEINSTDITVKCSVCFKSVPKSNIITHEAICHKSILQSTEEEATCQETQASNDTQEENDSSTKPKHRAKKRDQKDKAEATVTDDDLLAEMSKANSTCGYAKCKRGVNVLGFSCRFCRMRFCMEHNIPEVHGCAEEAKRHARSTQTKPGGCVAYNGRNYLSSIAYSYTCIVS